MTRREALPLLSAAAITGCSPKTEAPSPTPVTGGDQPQIHTLRNSKGMEARIATYGGIIVSLKVPDRNGKLDDIVLGFDSIDGYLGTHPYFGALIGRYGNRIANGQFTLNGTTYKLAKNNGPNALHGGIKGFDKVIWQTKGTPSGDKLDLSYTSADGEEGYPGRLTVNVSYALTETNELNIDYDAVTDKDTVVNLTSHSYFNLAGRGDIQDHRVTINASKFTPTDATLIPTGELKPVEGTPFDFRTPHAVRERIDAADPQLKYGKGYDHNYVLDKTAPKAFELAARVHDPASGRVMEIFTTEPGVQFYTGNSLDGTIKGKGGATYGPRSGLCLETQHFPDSPNKPQFPTTTLKAGERYRSTTSHRFSIA